MTPPDVRICFAIPTIPPAFGGGNRRLYRQAIYLAREGVDTTILTATRNNRDTIPNLSIIPVFAPTYFSERRFLLSRVLEYASLIAPFYRALRSVEPSLLHIVSYGGWSMMADAAARLAAIPTVIETTLAGSDDPLSVKRARLGSLRFRLMSGAHKIVSISPHLDEMAAEAGIPDSKREIIGNSADIHRFSPLGETEKKELRLRLGLGEYERILTYVGIIRPRKAVRTLIEMYARLGEIAASTGLLLIGPFDKGTENIDYYEEMKALADRLGVRSRTVFTGEVANVDEWMKASDVFVFASQQEGFGTVQVEAMASGLPVVAQRIRGITDYIIQDGHDGLVVDGVDEFVEAVTKVLSDPQLYRKLARNARQSAERRFSETAIMRRYVALYRAIGAAGSQG